MLKAQISLRVRAVTLDTLECFSGEQLPNETAHAQDDVNPHILRMLEGTFSLDAATCNKT